MSLRNALVKTSGTDVADTRKTGLRQTHSAAVLQKSDIAAVKAAGANVGRLAFLIDRTGSRSAAWRESRELQRELFNRVSNIGNLQTRLVHFGGNHLQDTDWSKDGKDIAARMDRLDCEAGGTQLVEGLHRFADLSLAGKADAIVMVGDCFEENESQMYAEAEKLKGLGIKVFAFHDDRSDKNYDTSEGARVFRRVAEITGGAFMRLGDNMELNELCEVVAAYTIGGQEEMRKLMGKSRAALEMGKQLRLPPPA